MGITGLLPFLKKASCSVNLKEFNGFVVAIDAYCWLHKSAYACAMDLALGNPTDHNKQAYRKKAAEHLLQGNREAAQECFQRSIFVTPQMAHDVILTARSLGVDCIVAPYEADSQLAYLNRAGYADLVITEDSDLLLFGCRQVLFKLDFNGWGTLVAVSAGIGESCCGMRPGQFSDSTLRYMGIISGCDYFSGIPGIGLITAAKILRQTRITEFRELLNKLGLYTNLTPAALNACLDPSVRPNPGERPLVTGGKRSLNSNTTKHVHQSLIDAAVRAERTFRLQVVFDPCTRSQQRLSEPLMEDLADERRMAATSGQSESADKENLFFFAGEVLEDKDKALQIALGNVDFEKDKVWDSFDPDQAKPPSAHNLKKPRSETNLRDHFARVPHTSPFSVRPVLGQLGTNAARTIAASTQPRRERLQMSIWDKNYPIQKVWVHRGLDTGDAKSTVNCLTVSNVSPTKPLANLDNVNTICTEMSEEMGPHSMANPHGRLSTRGKSLLVTAAMKRGLEQFESVDSRRLRIAASVTSTLPIQETNSTSAILGTYRLEETINQPVTPQPRLMDRSLLSSCVKSTSGYFESHGTTASQQDDVANALDGALDSERKVQPLRSPVFQRNPFCAPLLRELNDSDGSDVENDGTSATSMQLEKELVHSNSSPVLVSTSLASPPRTSTISPPCNRSPTFLAPSVVTWQSPLAIQPITPPESCVSSCTSDDESTQGSPSFLSAHVPHLLLAGSNRASFPATTKLGESNSRPGVTPQPSSPCIRSTGLLERFANSRLPYKSPRSSLQQNVRPNNSRSRSDQGKSTTSGSKTNSKVTLHAYFK